MDNCLNKITFVVPLELFNKATLVLALCQFNHYLPPNYHKVVYSIVCVYSIGRQTHTEVFLACVFVCVSFYMYTPEYKIVWHYTHTRVTRKVIKNIQIPNLLNNSLSYNLKHSFLSIDDDRRSYFNLNKTF